MLSRNHFFHCSCTVLFCQLWTNVTDISMCFTRAAIFSPLLPKSLTRTKVLASAAKEVSKLWFFRERFPSYYFNLQSCIQRAKCLVILFKCLPIIAALRQVRQWQRALHGFTTMHKSSILRQRNITRISCFLRDIFTNFPSLVSTCTHHPTLLGSCFWMSEGFYTTTHALPVGLNTPAQI